MEHALGDERASKLSMSIAVLILIVMEHALGVVGNLKFAQHVLVLILIVMEHALGVYHVSGSAGSHRLNPYCNGTCSRSLPEVKTNNRNGIVLILIVTEHALGGKKVLEHEFLVLILIVMEHALGALKIVIPEQLKPMS